MRKKIIFIDVDGPLAWATWGDGKVKINENTMNEFTIPYPWVKEDCEALQEICENTNAELVLSSDWKMHFTLKQMSDVFIEYGIYAKLIDTTTHMNTTQMDMWNKMSKPSLEFERAHQIVKWAKDNRISNWIAIDDMKLSAEFKWMKHRIPMWRHVQVDGDWGYGGKLRDKVDECIKKLNR
jgi:hypothetical protein